MDRPFLRYSFQSVDDEDIAAVVEVLKSPILTQGPKIVEFEEALSRYCSAAFGTACANGSGALHVACMAAGVSPGDEVITSPNTFVASAVCAVYCGAKPVFADIDRKTYNISPAEVEKKITKNTRAVIPVHFAGQSCDMEAIQNIVKAAEKKYGRKIFIIEDAAHALGSFYKNTKVGSCSYSDIAIMSFHPVKHITTGEGGMILTNDEKLANKMRRLRSHGITNIQEELVFRENAYEPAKRDSQPILRPWYYEQVYLGHHYRTSDIHCALGISQLKKLPKFIQRRREIVRFYNEFFHDSAILKKPYESPDCHANFHLYVLLFDFTKMKRSRPELIKELRDRNIQTQVHYIPVHTQPLYQKMFGTRWGDCPNAEWYYEKCLSIPLYPAMTDEDVQYVANTFAELCR